MMGKTLEEIGHYVLRFGLAIVFLWFGYSQMTDGASWIAWVPAWTERIFGIAPEMVVLLNGAFEVIAGTFIVLNLYTRWVALALAAHLAVITFEIGLDPTGVRDFGLTMATLALALLSPPGGPLRDN